ncbi:histone deacetylase family protein [Variovorax sp. PCZ-1]|uniref:histone deacetylase family protein n=1 Tax=Variovorax sp. PCZ-1 TaxID=2835533 RepID=UPI001BCDCFAD|nr:histone deacetylase family protein [Variovorax sp. PCZ-1]MBS7807389.1 histone deacetylase family protein [Variovorax sp. PCZ-1]
MKTFHNTAHHMHAGKQEMFRGKLVDCHEVPDRLEYVLAELKRRKMGNILAPADDLPLQAALEAVHTREYLEFLATAWEDWVQLDPTNAQRDALPSVWPLAQAHAFRLDAPPLNFAARLGQYAFDSGTPLTAGSWQAARQGAACALAAVHAVLAGERAAFALTRPPGHHAGPAYMGGYCFINNAAVAAQALRDVGKKRVAILDIDYHHGNGTQTCFYERADIFTLSIHGDPRTEYPFFLGHADERGAGAGAGFNLNIPLPRGTGFEQWFAALQQAIAQVRQFQAEALVVPLGVDTFEGDPISGFKLRSADYLSIGQALRELALPTVLTFEGGYAVGEVGVNVANVLEGFEA